MTLGGCIAHVDDALPCRFASRSVSVTPTLLPTGDEFPMNFEGLDVVFSTYLLFPAPFLRVEGERRRERGSLGSGA
jgi:hypothetical protein